MKIEVNNTKDLKKVANCIKRSKKKIIILSGDLGSGKTTLVKQFAKKATSPTFSIQNVYENNIYHYDLYNKTIEEFLSLGLLDELTKEGYHFIEWGEKLEDILKMYGFDYLKIIITVNNNKRIFECQNL